MASLEFSNGARSLIDVSTFQATLTMRDVPQVLNDVVAEGWTIDGDAVLLRMMKSSYFGDRTRFSNILGYEMAVNGRGIPDDDIVESGSSSIVALLRRGVAFAWSALHAANVSLPDAVVIGRVMVSPTLMNPQDYTGAFTFWHLPDLGLVPDVKNSPQIVVLLDSRECQESLPADLA